MCLRAKTNGVPICCAKVAGAQMVSVFRTQMRIRVWQIAVSTGTVQQDDCSHQAVSALQLQLYAVPGNRAWDDIPPGIRAHSWSGSRAWLALVGHLADQCQVCSEHMPEPQASESLTMKVMRWRVVPEFSPAARTLTPPARRLGEAIPTVRPPPAACSTACFRETPRDPVSGIAVRRLWK